MCKHVVLVPTKPNDEAALQKKVYERALFGRVWHTVRRAARLQHPAPHQFACCQWQTTPQLPLPYIIYRWLLFIFVVSIGVASFVCQTRPQQYHGSRPSTVNYYKWFIYFTNWGFLLLILQSGLALALTLMYTKSRSLNFPYMDEEQLQRVRTPLLVRVYWLTHQVATDFAFTITLVYWTVVHDPKIHNVNVINVLVHGVNSVVALSELVVTSHPFRFAHALFAVAMGTAYGVFSAGYWAVGGTDRAGLHTIYPSLDWNRPGLAIGFVSVTCVVCVCVHIVATLLTRLRVRLARRVCRAAASPPACERLTPNIE